MTERSPIQRPKRRHRLRARWARPPLTTWRVAASRSCSWSSIASSANDQGEARTGRAADHAASRTPDLFYATRLMALDGLPGPGGTLEADAGQNLYLRTGGRQLLPVRASTTSPASRRAWKQSGVPHRRLNGPKRSAGRK